MGRFTGSQHKMETDQEYSARKGAAADMRKKKLPRQISPSPHEPLANHRAKKQKERGDKLPSKISPTFEEKLNNRFAPSPIVADFDILLNAATDTNSFQSADDLANYLSEGALLQLNKIGSKALSIPCGEYMVWTTDTGNTMLVPTDLKTPEGEVFEAQEDQYELFTPDMLNNYNCFGKAILESETAEHPNFGENQAQTGGEEQFEGPHGGFQSKIHMQSVNRTPIARAMEQKGFTVTSLANACGVDPPAISRILRTPKDTVGDPGGRNPSMGLAAKISAALKMDAEALFPDIFNVPKQDFSARDTPANRGSGMKGAAHGSKRKGAATEKWTQGARGQQQNEDITAFTKMAKKLANDS